MRMAWCNSWLKRKDSGTILEEAVPVVPVIPGSKAGLAILSRPRG